MESLDVVRQLGQTCAVRRDHHLERQRYAPGLPLCAKALRVLVVDADVDGEQRLVERGRVGQRPQGGARGGRGWWGEVAEARPRRLARSSRSTGTSIRCRTWSGRSWRSSRGGA